MWRQHWELLHRVHSASPLAIGLERTSADGLSHLQIQTNKKAKHLTVFIGRRLGR
jgi:hypothetical protein